MQGEKLNGAFNLSRIPKELIKKNSKGEDVIYIDVLENKNGEDQYGNTHTITLYDKENRRSIYLANLKPQAFGAAPQQGYQPQPAQPQQGYAAPQQGYAEPRNGYAPPQGYAAPQPGYQQGYAPQQSVNPPAHGMYPQPRQPQPQQGGIFNQNDEFPEG